MKQITNHTGHALREGKLAANELLLPSDRAGDNVPGQIYAANEARFSSVNYSQPLTEYVVGWRNPEENLDALLEDLFPVVETSRRFEFKKAVNSEAFLSETDDVRAIGSAFKRVEYTGTSTNEKTLNKGLTIRIDHDDVLGDMWREQSAARLKDRLLRNEIRRGITLVRAAATSNTSVWNKDTNPDKDPRDRLRVAKNSSGIRPNRVLYADDAWDLRADAYETANTPVGYRASAMTTEELARKLRVAMVKIIGEVYQSTPSAKALLMQSLSVLIYNAQKGVGKDDPSNVKRFVTPTGDGRFRTYVVEHEKFTDISVEHYSNIVITSTLGIEEIVPAAA